jgi:hypothetical protein
MGLLSFDALLKGFQGCCGKNRLIILSRSSEGLFSLGCPSLDELKLNGNISCSVMRSVATGWAL